jgi:hypothetical protein
MNFSESTKLNEEKFSQAFFLILYLILKACFLKICFLSPDLIFLVFRTINIEYEENEIHLRSRSSSRERMGS